MKMHVYEVVAHNYAHASENKVHDDAVAARYGFRGGLVPGAADFAYLTRAVYGAWGDDWLHGGSMEAKFIKPIYHGELARAQAHETDTAGHLELALVDPRGETCAVGQAHLDAQAVPPDSADYPHHEFARGEDPAPPTVEDFGAGRRLAAYDYVHDADASVNESRELFVEPLVAADGGHRWHPGLAPHLGNQVVRSNVRLGAWIHTASRVWFHGAPDDGDEVSVRGHVAQTYEKRGHVMTDCDLAVFANGDRPLLHMHHIAIIRLAGDR